ncbi:hypothetical protein RchiOBHm_Chr5g0026431 [Rosa chinensis]|uniref:Non-specific serine/threonine protein kinase n=1 Tax=Rosa chinensis TaxID=74649 RepID=A0A2P6Q8U8_ROSCH|nr:hypothetical protein RchiOBHm_Chr5g0026431 [Rosa chinensis]
MKDGSDNEAENFQWQSFDYPGDTFLQCLKLGSTQLQASTGIYHHGKIHRILLRQLHYQLDPIGYPKLILRQGSVTKFGTGPRNGIRFSKTPHLSPNPLYTYGLVFLSR